MMKRFHALFHHERFVSPGKPFRRMKWGPAHKEWKLIRQAGPPCWEPIVLGEEETHLGHRFGILVVNSRKVLPEALAESKRDAHGLSHNHIANCVLLLLGQLWTKADGALLVTASLKHP